MSGGGTRLQSQDLNDEPLQPVHQVVIPNLGLLIGEIWDLDLLAEDCAADGR